MGAGKKILIATGIAAGIGGIIWGISYLMGKKKVGDKLDTVTNAMIHSLDGGLTLRVDVILKNPTEGTLTIKQPYIKVLYDTKDLGSSQIQNTEIVIPPYGVKALNAIYLKFPLLQLLKLGAGIYNILVKKQPVKITTITYTSIKIGSKFLSYQKPDVITLKPKA
jgi:hypothetical protein